ncbi:hypothetical protein FHS56_002077 [Thermonema lapsum]|uniref:GSCFA domain-containing protein n=1 Tax=Thermonema lapsum TaxID=28195 RepID=A0A846MTA0_9BACT|nr:GSCFA domain-containing protein [Thermonema lapsum]NIK74552.1 hypothetical protein [Thermonema lapsum]
MKWFTPLSFETLRLPMLSYGQRILCIGSCFADEMGKLLTEAKFSVLNNPFGVLFNPVSLYRCYSAAVYAQEAAWQEGVLKVSEDLYLHYDCHSKVYGSSEQSLIERIMSIGAEVRAWQPEIILLTLGTSIVYEHCASGKVVANCHKQPASLFRKRTLQLAEIVEALNHLHALWKGAKAWIVTVSPVRHVKEGLVENQYSKSLLRVAVEAWRQQHENIFYFPSYEIMIDELRDYRFYAEDLVHPSAQAIGYIWDVFTAHCFEAETQKTYVAWRKLSQQLAHRALFPHTAENKQRLQRLLSALQRLSTKLPLHEEIAQVQRQLQEADTFH